MKKRFIILLSALLLSSVSSIAFEDISFNVGIIDPTGAVPGHPKTPVLVPQATLEDNVLTFEASHPDYALTLFDEDGEMVYQTTVLAGTDTVVLPSTLSGDYVLTLDFGGSYYFWSEIEL